MQTNVETLSPLERRVNMEVAAQEIDREVEQRLKKLTRTVRLAGFRPGKVPLKIVAQHYGPQVRSEVIGDAVQKAFTDVVREQNLRVAGQPRIERKDDAAADQIAFSAVFEVYPEVKLGDLAGAAIEKRSVTVGEGEIDQTVEILRKQRARWEDATRPSQKGDRVTVDFTGRIDGVEFPGGQGKGVVVELGEGRMLPQFEAALTGVGPGAHLDFNLDFPADYAAKEVAGKTARFEADVRAVQSPALPEVDAEFAKTLGVADGDTGRMREEVKSNVEREVRKRLENDLRQRVMQALVDTTQVELPKSLVELEMQRLVQQARADLESRGIRMEQLPVNPAAIEEQARRRVALGLIVAELVKQHGLAPKPEQVRALVEDYAQSYEQPTEVVKWIYSEPQRLGEFEGLAVESNVVAWVLQHARVEDKAISFDELMGRAA